MPPSSNTWGRLHGRRFVCQWAPACERADAGDGDDIPPGACSVGAPSSLRIVWGLRCVDVVSVWVHLSRPRTPALLRSHTFALSHSCAVTLLCPATPSTLTLPSPPLTPPLNLVSTLPSLRPSIPPPFHPYTLPHFVLSYSSTLTLSHTTRTLTHSHTLTLTHPHSFHPYTRTPLTPLTPLTPAHPSAFIPAHFYGRKKEREKEGRWWRAAAGSSRQQQAAAGSIRQQQAAQVLAATAHSLTRVGISD